MDLQPLFWSELSHNKSSMGTFAHMTREERLSLLARVGRIQDPSNLRILVESLDRREMTDSLIGYE